MEKSNNAQKERKTTDKADAKDKKENRASNSIPKDPNMNVDENMPPKPKTYIETEEESTEKMKEDLEYEALKQKLNEKITQIEGYQDRLLRAQAELENYKKRTDKELNEFKVYANAQLVKDILIILDDFQNALAAGKKGSDNEFFKGFELIYNNLSEIMEKEGLCMINPENEKFDPWKHEAVETVPTDEYDEHTIMQVLQPGYKFKDKMLRPAKVRVAILPKVNEENSIKEEEKEDLGRKKSDDSN